MLRINRVKIEIVTVNGVYGIDQKFQRGLNFISSMENTCGKSSILAVIYYCLGFEQILGGAGGIGSKVLTSALKTSIEDKGQSFMVTESGAYLEISNGTKIITIYRHIKSESKDDRLITVYFGTYDEIGNPTIQSEDFYVNTQNSAINDKGFHLFMEEFIGMELPLVRTADGNERKLYLQLVFSAMFIEQKHGWGDILSGMPIFGIRESKKRIIEYILGLDVLRNEKERDRLNNLKSLIEQEWEQLVLKIRSSVDSQSCEIRNLPLRPKVLLDADYSRIALYSENNVLIVDEINNLQKEHEKTRELKPKACENFDKLNAELVETNEQILVFEKHLADVMKDIAGYNEAIARLENDLEIIDSDIRNNNDSARLLKFGSESIDNEFLADVCPVCKQRIQDSLLDAGVLSGFMSIEENIRHLKEQKKMIEFTLGVRKESLNKMYGEKEKTENGLKALQRLSYALRSDLFSTTEEAVSEAMVLKRIELSNRIERLTSLVEEKNKTVDELRNLSIEWNGYLDQKNKLPKKDVSEQDEEKIKLLKAKFIENLKRYNYSSLSNFDGIDISFDSALLPTIDGFDMKFDSSASDGIRVIWAFTLALLQVSIEKGGNHPGIIIFDEPAQQSIVPEDMNSFIRSVIEIDKPFQLFMALTLNSQELKDIINGLDPKIYYNVGIEDKAFKRFA